MRRIFDTEEKIRKLLEKFDSGWTVVRIASYFSCQCSTVERELRLHDRSPSKRVTKIDAKAERKDKKNLDTDPTFLAAYMSGMPAKSLAEKFNVARGTAQRYIDKMRISGVTRTHTLTNRTVFADFRFFDKIDTEQKAYILGLLYADGCNFRYRISLALTDYQIVKDVMSAMKADPCEPLYAKARTEGSNPSYSFTLSSRYICNRLSELGCHPRKSLTLTFPNSDQVPSELLHHFVRGYFDGDGSIFLGNKKQGYYFIDITGTKSFVEGLSGILPFETKVMPTRNRAWCLKVYAQSSVFTFREIMYRDATICLERKKLKFLNLPLRFDPKWLTSPRLLALPSQQTQCDPDETEALAEPFGDACSPNQAIQDYS